MVSEEINVLDELSSASKLHNLNQDDIHLIMLDFAKRLTRILRIERINVWLFNSDKSGMISIAEFDQRNDNYSKDSVITKKDYPNYFNLLAHNKFIYIQDCYTNELVSEMKETYFKPNDVVTLVDVPLRIGGEIFGVMCFEKTGQTIRNYTDQNLNFMYSIATVLGSNLEARYRRATQFKLDEIIKEKELLIQEINHRVKNNFSVLVSLLRLNKSIIADAKVQFFCDEFEQRIFSMLKIHELLLTKNQFSEINLTDYIQELIKEFKNSNPILDLSFDLKISNIEQTFDSKRALHIGMILTEIFLNSVKHAVSKNQKLVFHFEIYSKDGFNFIKVGDNGPGFDFQVNEGISSLGLSLIKNLSETIECEIRTPSIGDSSYELTFK